MVLLGEHFNWCWLVKNVVMMLLVNLVAFSFHLTVAKYYQFMFNSCFWKKLNSTKRINYVRWKTLAKVGVNTFMSNPSFLTCDLWERQIAMHLSTDRALRPYPLSCWHTDRMNVRSRQTKYDTISTLTPFIISMAFRSPHIPTPISAIATTMK